MSSIYGGYIDPLKEKITDLISMLSTAPSDIILSAYGTSGDLSFISKELKSFKQISFYDVHYKENVDLGQEITKIIQKTGFKLKKLGENISRKRIVFSIFDLEKVFDTDSIEKLNIYRDLFLRIEHPVLIWINEKDVGRLALKAPDFWRIRTRVFFFRENEILNSKANALVDLGKYDEALVYYDKGLQTNPDDASIWYNKGLLLVLQGRINDGKKCLEKSADIDNNLKDKVALVVTEQKKSRVQPPIESEPEIPPITEPSPKTVWSSEKWNNGIERMITGDGSDPEDARFAVRQLDNGGYCKIPGNGMAEIGGKGRFYVFKKDVESAIAKQTQYLWSPSVEVSFDINVDSILSSDKRFINLGGCTNHFVDVSNNSNGRNYSVVGRYDGDGIGFKKETIHGAYDEYLMIDKKLKTKTWYNIRYKQTPIETDRKIKLEGWIDGTKIGEYIDDGNMTKDTSEIDPVVRGGDKSALYYPIKNGKMVWTAGAYSGLYIRLTGTIKTFIKNLSVKEV